MPNSISFLTDSRIAQNGRKARGADCVVHIERSVSQGPQDKVFFELDADDFDHAVRLAETWVEVHGAISAAIRPVKSSGAVGGILRMIS
jgi:hypothetical protein